MNVGARFGIVLAIVLAVSTAQAAPAAAVSITNRDEREHKITVIEEDGGKSADFVLKPNQLLENVCAKGCVIRLNDSDEDEYELIDGTEIVSIEDGYLYYDQPEDSPTTPSNTPPTAPPATTPPAQSPGGKRG